MKSIVLVSGMLVLALTQPTSAQETFFAIANSESVTVPTGSDATGACVGVLEAGNFDISCSHTVQDVTVAHIHEAPLGSNGGVVFPFASAVSPIEQSFMMSPAQQDTLRQAGYYVNIHSVAFGGGEIRGQLVADALFADGFE